MSGETESRYLVVARCGMDDLPLGLFDSFVEAEQYIASVDRGTVTGFAGSVFELDVSVFCNLSVVEFNGWMPVRWQGVRDLEHDATFNLGLEDDE